MKRGLTLKTFFVFLFALFFINEVSSLALTPAKISFDFTPNLESSIQYRVDRSNRELEVFVEGDLAKYIILSETKVNSGDSFIATLKLPDKLEKPGKNFGFVGVRELVDPEVIGGAVGTSITLLSRIEVNVPYPGKWLDIDLGAYDVNINEPVNFFLYIKSQGDEEVLAKSRIEIYSESGSLLKTLYFNERAIQSQEEINLTKSLDTTGFNAGNYKAVAVVDYDIKNATDNETFRIGELIINLINHTQEIVIDKIQAFDIGIESGWNDKIDGAYGEVSISNVSGQTIVEFKTSSTSLIPWENRTITGYFDTSNFTAGNYSANITLIYYGKDVGKSSSEIVTVKFIEKPNNLLIIMGVIVIVVLIISIVIWRYLRKNAKRKK